MCVWNVIPHHGNTAYLQCQCALHSVLQLGVWNLLCAISFYQLKGPESLSNCEKSCMLLNMCSAKSAGGGYLVCVSWGFSTCGVRLGTRGYQLVMLA